MSSDSDPQSNLIKGDVLPGSVRRVTGERGSTAGLIELGLVGHPHRYRVKIEMGGGAPRLIELHMVPADPAAPVDIDPAAIRQVPARRLASAAARFISSKDFAFAMFDEMDDPAAALRPDRPPNGGRNRKLDDVHYRQVADLLRTAREYGYPPREFVSERLGASIPTVDRWIKEAKKRNHLPRDWATATSEETDR